MTRGTQEERGPRWWRLIPVLILFLGAAGSIIYNENLKARAQVFEPGSESARPVPDFTLPDLESASVTLSDYRGGPIFLNFWTTWCDACREETFALETFYRRYGDRIRQLSINVGELEGRIHRFKDAFGTTYPILMDRSSRISEMYRLQAVPESWFIDERGIARIHHLGLMRFEDMQKAYERTVGRPIDGQGVAPLTAGRELLAVSLAPVDAGAWPIRDPEVLLAAGELFTGNPAHDRWQQVVFSNEGRPIVVDLVQRDGMALGLAADGQLWQLEAAGAVPVGNPVPVSENGASILALDPSNDNRLLVWARVSGFWYSEDFGQRWQRIDAGALSGTVLYSLAFDPTIPGRLLAGTSRGLWESEDSGSSWRQVTLNAANPDPEGQMPWDPRFPRAIYDVIFSVAEPGKVYYATYHGVWIGTGGGRNLSYQTESPARVLRSLSLIAIEGAEHLLAGAPNGDLYLSHDSGTTWRLLDPGG